MSTQYLIIDDALTDAHEARSVNTVPETEAKFLAAMERAWLDCLSAPVPDYLPVRPDMIRFFRRPHGSRLVLLSDEAAMELGIQHLMRSHCVDTYYAYYDRRRVKRARRQRARHLAGKVRSPKWRRIA